MVAPASSNFFFISSASSGFKDSTWKNIFYDNLQKMGHDVVFFSYEEATFKDKIKTSSISIISENIYDNFIKHHKKKKFDLFFSYYHSLNVNPELFKKLKVYSSDEHPHEAQQPEIFEI